MSEFFPLDDFLHCLVALISVSNVIPVMPAVQEFTSDLSTARGRNYTVRALLSGNAVAVIFMFLGPFILSNLALTVDDLRVAGGVVLLAYATHDILFSRLRSSRRQISNQEDLGPPIAPLGVPVLVGPATLSLLLVLTEVYGRLAVGGALAVNLTINLVCVVLSDRLLRLLGEGSSRAMGKVMSLILATLGVGMFRQGLQSMMSTT